MNSELTRDRAIMDYLSQTLWVMEPVILERMAGIVIRHADGIKIGETEIRQVMAARDAGRSDDYDRYRLEGRSAVIPVHGVLVKHSRQVNGMSQPRGTSCEQIAADLADALADRSVERIVLHIDSPGGSVAGIASLGEQIAAAHRTKPVIAYAEDQAASGAYWLASQAGKIYANTTACIGSIGVYMVLVDSSKAAERWGESYTIIRSGQFKGVGVPGTKLENENLANLQSQIQSLHERFVAAVAAGRQREISDISPLADGRCLIGSQAATAGLIDGIKTLGQVLAGDTQETSVAAHAGEPGSSAPVSTPRLEGVPPMPENVKTYSAADLEQARKDAVAENTKRVQAVTKVLAGHPDLLAQALADPTCDETAATALLVPKLQAQIAQLQAEGAEKDKKLAAIAQGGGPLVATDTLAQDGPAPGTPAGNAAAPAADDGQAATYEKRVEALKAAGDSEAAAMRKAGNELPKCHQAWLAKNQ